MPLDPRKLLQIVSDIAKIVFGRGASPPWTPHRGAAPGPRRGPGFLSGLGKFNTLTHAMEIMSFQLIQKNVLIHLQ